MTKKKENYIKLLKQNKIPKNIIDAIMIYDQKIFFDHIFRNNFYSKKTIPIRYGENSDPPMALAKMIYHLSLRKTYRILEIGTGSGYSTAILSSLVEEIVTIEYHKEIAFLAKKKIEPLNIDNVRFFNGDGLNLDKSLGIFDAIVVFAACQQRPFSLNNFLRRDGLLVFPMGPIHQQQITVLTNKFLKDSEEHYKTTFHDYCIFPPINGIYEKL